MRGPAASRRGSLRALLPRVPVRPLGQQDGAGSDGGRRARMRRTSLKGVRAPLKRKRTQKRSVLLIGAGRMGSALIKGWIAAGRFSPIHVVEPAPSAALKSLARKRAIILHGALPTALPRLAAVVLAVKPQVLKGEDKLLKTLGKSGALVLSIAAGIGTPLLRQKVGH